MRALLLCLACATIACGGGAAVEPAPATPRTTHEAPPPPREPAKPRMMVEYVVVHARWVEKNVPAPPADVGAWYETPEGRAAVPPHKCIAPFDSKKKASAALARLKKKEACDAVLRDATNVLGELPKTDAAVAALADGDAALVEEKGLFVVVGKTRPTDEALERAYRKAKAPEAAQKLASEILERMKRPEVDVREAIADAVTAVLGDRAVADPSRPSPVVVDEERLRIARVPPEAKKALERMLKDGHAGDVLPAPVADGGDFVVARSVAPRS